MSPLRLVDRTSPRPLLSTSLNGDIYLGRPNAGRRLEALVVTAGSAEDEDSDADLWEAMLRERGFTVHRLVNPSLSQFDKGLADFVGASATGASLASQSAIAPTGSSSAAGGPEANALFMFVFVGQAARLDGQTRLGFSDSMAENIEASTASLDAVATALAGRAAASVLVVDAAFTLNTGTATLRRTP